MVLWGPEAAPNDKKVMHAPPPLPILDCSAVSMQQYLTSGYGCVHELGVLVLRESMLPAKPSGEQNKQATISQSSPQLMESIPQLSHGLRIPELLLIVKETSLAH